MSILVTGGVGYIASHMIDLLCSKGEEVIAFDKESDNGTFFEGMNVKFVQGNLLDVQVLEKIFKENNIEAVIHFAAKAQVKESVDNPQMYYLNNVLGSINLFDTMVKYNVKKLIFSSSAAVYGNPVEIPIKEGDPKSPTSPYGRSKKMGEEILSDYFNAYGLLSVSLRYFNVCGASESGRFGENHNPETHIIPLIIQNIYKENGEFTLYGTDYDTPDGTCIRDYIHVMDLAEAHYLALNKMRKGFFTEPEVYNAGYGHGFSNLEIIKKCEEVTGKKLNFTTGGRRAGDPGTLIADNSKIVKILGWESKYDSLDVIINSVVKYYNK
ncbi:UDP-glucose 4-epimerase GalE [Eubacteriales bacterium OttesenSCG-928-G02]|nr:UDP-glucose 4-epimerase GalE [Eubacteriales bacterium OttesenSCG-928-G02]